MMWVAAYADGTSLTQYKDGVEISTDAVDRSKLLSFSIFNGAGKKIVSLDYYSGDKFFYRRRSLLRPGGAQDFYIIFGKRFYLDGKEVVTAVFVDQSGTIEVGRLGISRNAIRGDEHKGDITFDQRDDVAVI